MAERTTIFNDRADAGKRLAAALPQLDPATSVVLALPRGGVPVAAEICAMHHLPLDLLLVRKIGAPGHAELALGAVADGATPKVHVNNDVARHYNLTREQVEEMGQALLPEIARRRQAYLSGRQPLDVRGKTVVVVDDGVATGATLRASLLALQALGPARVIVALPVGPDDLVERLNGLAEMVICLGRLGPFGAVGGAYLSFPQVDDATVRSAVDRFTAAAER